MGKTLKNGQFKRDFRKESRQGRENILSPVFIMQRRKSDMAQQLTRLMTISGVIYTELSPAEIRPYLQGGVKANVINGFEDAAGTIPIMIHVEAIEYIYL